MSVFEPLNIYHPEQLTLVGKSFAAATLQYVAAVKRDPPIKLLSFSNTLAGVGTGAAMFVASLSLLHFIGG